jgi:PAS domain S-box-containing protein
MDERTATVPNADHGGIDEVGYRTLVEALPIPIAVVEPDTTVRVWNAAAARLFGWTAPEVLGRPSPVVPDDERDGSRRIRDAIARGDVLADVDTRCRGKDGRLMELSISGAPLRDHTGRVVRTILVYRDLGERRRIEEQRERIRRDAEDAHRRGDFLAEASEVLASSLDYATTLEHVARLAVPVLADYCVIDIVEDGQLRRVAAAHADPMKDPLVQELRGQTPSADVLERVGRVMATGEPDVVADLDLERALTLLPEGPRRTLVRNLGPRSYIVVALRARGSSVGSMTFVFADSGRRYHRVDVALAQELARRAALALDNARLHQAEQRAREDAETAERRMAFLANASAVLASSLDYETTLRTVADLAVPFVADWCSVDVVQKDGAIRRLALVHADPSKRDLARAASTYPPDPEGRHPRTQVLRTGRSVLMPVIRDSDLEHLAPDEARLQVFRALAYRSAMIVPLTVRGETLGALTFATMESERTYGADELSLAEELARRVGMAVDNARLFQAERHAHAEAQAANRAKDEFLTTVSHELRTPLQAMLGWVAVLRQGKLPEGKRERALDIIEQSGRTQARLIGDLLDVSRMVSGRLLIEPRPVTLPPIIQAAVDAVQPAAEAKRVQLRCLFDPTVGPVAGDPDRLQQIFWNLLSNGVKFTPSGGRVELRLERDDAEVRIVVTDTGDGIARDFLPYVFERFRQAEDVRSPKRRSGVGLGLAIVRHLTELHGGRVLVESDGPGRGATFSVVLPIAPLEAKTQDNVEIQRSHR